VIENANMQFLFENEMERKTMGSKKIPIRVNILFFPGTWYGTW
jgi:hypothetical protein